MDYITIADAIDMIDATVSNNRTEDEKIAWLDSSTEWLRTKSLTRTKVMKIQTSSDMTRTHHAISRY